MMLDWLKRKPKFKAIIEGKLESIQWNYHGRSEVVLTLDTSFFKAINDTLQLGKPVRITLEELPPPVKEGDIRFVRPILPLFLQEMLGPVCTAKSIKDNAKYLLNTKIDVDDQTKKQPGVCDIAIYTLWPPTYRNVINLCEVFRPVGTLFKYRLPTLKEWVVFIWAKTRGWLLSLK